MKEFNRHKSVYPIGVVQNLTGLSKRQIRYYEETDLVVPDRTSGNQRMYSLADVEKLLRVKKLIEGGMNIEEVKSHFAERADREVDTNTLPHLKELAENSDLRARFQSEIQSLTDGRPAENPRFRSDHAPLSDRPPELPPGKIQSLYPVRDRSSLADTVLQYRNKRSEEERNQKDHET